MDFEKKRKLIDLRKKRLLIEEKLLDYEEQNVDGEQSEIEKEFYDIFGQVFYGLQCCFREVENNPNNDICDLFIESCNEFINKAIALKRKYKCISE